MRSLTQLSRAVVAALVLAIALSASITASAQTTVYDAVNDFSITNSSGIWSYGYTVTRGSEFINYVHPHVNVGPGFDVWNMAPSNTDPQAVYRNTTGEPRNYGGTVTQPADMLNLHPGLYGEYSVVRWTAQKTGAYQIQGRFKNLDSGNATTDVAVFHNSTGNIFNGNIDAATQELTFASFIYVEAGETVEFSVGRGNCPVQAYSCYSNDSTGLAATIKPFVISGRVTDECGLGIGGAEVRLQTGTFWTTTTTDERGWYSFDNPSFGKNYTVTVQLTDQERRLFEYVPQSYTFTALNDTQTANFIRRGIKGTPPPVCRLD